MTDAKIKARDRELEARHNKAQVELCNHRWHWTLDDNNDERMSMRAYARLVGRSSKAIQKHAKGYQLWMESGDVEVATLSDCIARASMGAETEAATEAFAAANDTTFHNAATHHRREVRAVVEHAREKAEETGERVEDVIHSVAARSAQTNRNRREAEDRRKKEPNQWFPISIKIDNADTNISRALEMIEGVEFDDEEKEILAESIDELSLKLDNLRLGITGELS